MFSVYEGGVLDFCRGPASPLTKVQDQFSVYDDRPEWQPILLGEDPSFAFLG